MPPDIILSHGPEGTLCIDPGITPPVLIPVDLESVYREISTTLQGEEEENSQQSASAVMTSEVEGQLLLINVVASDDGGGEDKTTVTSSGSYWGNTRISKQEILHSRVLCVKRKRGE